MLKQFYMWSTNHPNNNKCKVQQLWSQLEMAQRMNDLSAINNLHNLLNQALDQEKT